MSQVAEVTFIMGLSAIFGALLIVKLDKQLTHILEGRMFVSGKKISSVNMVYKNNRSPVHLLSFTVGCAGISAFIIYIDHSILASVIILMSSILLLLHGTYGRFKTFKACKRELELQ